MAGLTKPSQATKQEVLIDSYRMYIVPESHSMQFIVVQLAGENVTDEWYSDTCNNVTEDLDKALQVMCGFIKWDGCLDIKIAPDHYCGRQSAEIVGELINAIYDVAARRIPAWSPEDAA